MFLLSYFFFLRFFRLSDDIYTLKVFCHDNDCTNKRDLEEPQKGYNKSQFKNKFIILVITKYKLKLK